MRNTGTWDSTMALIFFIAFTMPVWLMLLREIFKLFLPTEVVRVVEKPVTVYKTRTVYRDREKPIRVVYKDREPVKKQDQIAPKPNNKTEKFFISEVSSCLVKMGVDKKDAKKRVLEVAKSKVYKSSEDLLQDCIATL